MLNIFFISNDNRVEKLIEHFQPFFKSKIRRAFDFDQGLKEVFENRPSVVFIQSDIGAVSGETVARHIKSLLGSDSPRIVFMGEDDAKGKTGNSWCDDWILLSDSEQGFQEEFTRLIAAYYPEAWRDIFSEISKTVPQTPDAETEGVTPEDPLAADAPTDRGVCDSCDTEGGKDKFQGTSTEKRIVSFRADMLPQDAGAVPDEDFPAYQVLSGTEFQEDDVFPKKSGVARRFRVWILLLSALAVAGGAVYSLRYLDRRSPLETTQLPPSEISGKSAVSATKPPNGLKGLPSFIHPEWRDLAYTKAHPGWEKYVSSEYEFHVFRKHGVIKALQVVARDKKGISEPFITSVLKELGFSGPLPTGVSERKDGFLVKRLLISGFAELVTYREEGDERLKAFVLEFS